MNHYGQFVKKRFDVGSEVILRIEDIYEEKQNFLSEQKSRKFLQKLKKLMREGDRKAEYSAVVATTILESEDYWRLETYLIENNLWDEEFQQLKAELQYCALLPPR